MKIARIVTAGVLLLFVGATVGVLIAQQVSNPSVADQAEAAGGVLRPSDDPALPSPQAGAPIPADNSIEDDEAAEVENIPADQREADELEDPPEAAPQPIVDQPQETCVVDAIYFHNTQRCYTCRKIEETARAIMEAEFASEFASGRLRWSTVDMQEQPRFVEQYQLAMPTLILARRIGDEAHDWIALDETWQLIGSEMRFSLYVIDHMREFLEGCP